MLLPDRVDVRLRIRFDPKRAVDVGRGLAVDDPAEGGRNQRVESFEAAGDRRGDPAGLQRPPYGGLADVDRRGVDQTEDERSTPELCLQERWTDSDSHGAARRSSIPQVSRSTALRNACLRPS